MINNDIKNAYVKFCVNIMKGNGYCHHAALEVLHDLPPLRESDVLNPENYYCMRCPINDRTSCAYIDVYEKAKKYINEFFRKVIENDQ